jgi:hypothetical protein
LKNKEGKNAKNRSYQNKRLINWEVSIEKGKNNENAQSPARLTGATRGSPAGLGRGNNAG